MATFNANTATEFELQRKREELQKSLDRLGSGVDSEFATDVARHGGSTRLPSFARNAARRFQEEIEAIDKALESRFGSERLAREQADRFRKDPGAVIEQFGEFREGRVEAFAEEIRPHFEEQIGVELGRLQASGVLRSGATTEAVKDVNEEFSRQIGFEIGRQTERGIEDAFRFGEGSASESIARGGLEVQRGRLGLEREAFEASQRGGFGKFVGGVLGAAGNIGSELAANFVPGGGAAKTVAASTIKGKMGR